MMTRYAMGVLEGNSRVAQKFTKFKISKFHVIIYKTIFSCCVLFWICHPVFVHIFLCSFILDFVMCRISFVTLVWLHISSRRHNNLTAQLLPIDPLISSRFKTVFKSIRAPLRFCSQEVWISLHNEYFVKYYTFNQHIYMIFSYLLDSHVNIIITFR